MEIKKVGDLINELKNFDADMLVKADKIGPVRIQRVVIQDCYSVFGNPEEHKAVVIR